MKFNLCVALSTSSTASHQSNIPFLSFNTLHSHNKTINGMSLSHLEEVFKPNKINTRFWNLTICWSTTPPWVDPSSAHSLPRTKFTNCPPKLLNLQNLPRVLVQCFFAVSMFIFLDTKRPTILAHWKSRSNVVSRTPAPHDLTFGWVRFVK